MRAIEIIAIAIAMLFLIGMGMLHDRDARIAQLETAAATCQATRENEIAAQSYRDGVIECAITSGHSGDRTISRFEYRT